MLAAGLILFLAGATARADGGWLDRPLANWNRPGMTLPASDRSEGDAVDLNCLRATRPPESDEEAEVVAAGWMLVGAYQGGWDVRVVTGTGGFDGMCRPAGYQVFVFAGGRLVGTLSPVAMLARTDGSVTQTFLGAPSSNGGLPSLIAVFNRYAETDALCCPSGESSVTYRIDQTAQGAVLVPVEVTTMARRP